MDHKILKNFRPIGNLQFVSSLTEKAEAKQITDHMIINPLFSKPAALSILLCLRSDDFTRQWGTPGSQWVNGLFPSLQSAYHKYHSTETALLKVKK